MGMTHWPAEAETRPVPSDTQMLQATNDMMLHMFTLFYIKGS